MGLVHFVILFMFKNQKLTTLFEIWLVLAAIITVLCALLYLTLQQQIRLSANDTQIQLSEDAATALESGGVKPQDYTLPPAIDISQSLAPFVILFDDKGQPIASSAKLNAETPVPPSGVFENARQYGQDRITWQPQAGVRIAMVLVHYNGPQPGFVLAGRNLREVETHEDALSQQVGAAWIILMAFVAAGWWFTVKQRA